MHHDIHVGDFVEILDGPHKGDVAPVESIDLGFESPFVLCMEDVLGTYHESFRADQVKAFD
jgi:hypothetical protein